MAVTIKSLGIDRLGMDQRLALVEELWDSIAADSGALPVTGAQRMELDRCLTDHTANPDDVLPWEEIKAELVSRLGK